MNWRIVAVLGLLSASLAFGEDAAQRNAREELEHQLKQMVGTPPTRVRVDFVSPNEPNYVLESATFEVDGKEVKSVPLATLSNEGTHAVFWGDVTPGKHKVSTKMVFASKASALVSDEGGFKWKVGGDTSFDVDPGIEVQVQIMPSRDSAQKDIAKRFKLRIPAKPVMVATLDDGKMPPMPPEVDLTKTAGETGIPPTSEKPAGVVKGQPGDGLGEPRHAPSAQGIAVGEPAPGTAPEPVDAGEIVAAAPVVVEPPAADLGPVAAAPAEAVDEGRSRMWPWLVGGGVLGLLILFFVMSRRRSPPPAGRG